MILVFFAIKILSGNLSSLKILFKSCAMFLLINSFQVCGMVNSLFRGNLYCSAGNTGPYKLKRILFCASEFFLHLKVIESIFVYIIIRCYIFAISEVKC